MKRTMLAAFAATLLSGCAAQMLETHGDKVRLLDIGQPKRERGGVLRYLNTGLQSMRKARRQDAEKQMRGFCSGPYSITEEGPRSKFGARMPIGAKASFELDEYQYVAFECAAG
jgi:hypothetical protein